MLHKKRLIDIGLIFIIIVMAVLVTIEMDRMFDFRQEDPKKSVADAETTPTEMEAFLAPSAMVAIDTSLPAPDFKLEDLSGETITLSDFRGKAVMINFWAIWCPPCRAELPLIQFFADKHQPDLVVLAVNAGEDQANVQNYIEEMGYNLIFLLDSSNAVATDYQVRGLPTSVFIDEEGILQATHIGELNETLLSTYLIKIGVNE